MTQQENIFQHTRWRRGLFQRILRLSEHQRIKNNGVETSGPPFFITCSSLSLSDKKERKFLMVIFYSEVHVSTIAHTLVLPCHTHIGLHQRFSKLFGYGYICRWRRKRWIKNGSTLLFIFFYFLILNPHILIQYSPTAEFQIARYSSVTLVKIYNISHIGKKKYYIEKKGLGNSHAHS